MLMYDKPNHLGFLWNLEYIRECPIPIYKDIFMSYKYIRMSLPVTGGLLQYLLV